MICLFLQKPVSRLISLAKLLIIYSPWKQCPPDLREHLFSWINYRRKEEGFSPLIFNFSLGREAHALAVAQHETVFPQWNSYSPIQPAYFTRFLPYAQYAAGLQNHRSDFELQHFDFFSSWIGKPVVAQQANNASTITTRILTEAEWQQTTQVGFGCYARLKHFKYRSDYLFIVGALFKF